MGPTGPKLPRITKRLSLRKAVPSHYHGDTSQEGHLAAKAPN